MGKQNGLKSAREAGNGECLRIFNNKTAHFRLAFVDLQPILHLSPH